MKRESFSYYRRKMHGGRNAFARAFDFIALRFAIFAASYIWFLFEVGNQLLALGLAAITMLMFSVSAHMLERIRLEKFMQKYRDALRKRLLLEQIVLSDVTPCVNMLCDYLQKVGMTIESRKGGVIFARRGERLTLVCLLARLPVSPVDAQEVLQLVRQARGKDAELMAFSSSGFTAEAKDLLSRLPKGKRVQLFSGERLLALASDAGLLPDDATIDSAVEKEIQREQARFSRFRSAALLPGKTKRYLMCALVIFAASFVTGYQVYYFILAGVCLSLAGVSLWISRQQLPEQEPSQSI